MMRYITLITVIIALSARIYCVDFSAEQLYTIVPTTVGDDSVVKAIQQHSHITTNYVNRWKPFRLWIIGSSLRSGAVDAINSYINVCKSLKLAHYTFPDEESLKNAFPINWTIGALCLALKNLREQGMNALALVAQVGGDEVKGLDDTITSYLATIDHNRNVLKSACVTLAKKREEKETLAVKLALDKATISEKKAKSWADTFGIAKSFEALYDPSKLVLFGLYSLASKAGAFGASNTEGSE